MSLSGMKLHLLNVFFCVALLDKRVASWSSVSNFSNSATLRCACLLPICLLGMLNDLGCFFLLKINKYLYLCITNCVQRPLALLPKNIHFGKRVFQNRLFCKVLVLYFKFFKQCNTLMGLSSANLPTRNA